MKLWFVFFIVVLIWGLTTPTSLHAQDSLVRIKPSTARWFLEQSDKVVILTKKDSLSSHLIHNLEAKASLKDSLITSYKSDSTHYQEQTKTFLEVITLKERRELRLEKALGRQKTVTSISLGMTAGAIAGSIVPAIGTVVGALIGGGVGIIYRIIHKRNEQE